MVTILYPQLTAPVPFSGPMKETVTESRWHQPWSEPVRFRGGPNLKRPALLTGEQPWFSFQPEPPDQMVEGWFAPLSEPKRFKRGLTAANQVAYPFYTRLIPSDQVGLKLPLYIRSVLRYPASYWKGRSSTALPVTTPVIPIPPVVVVTFYVSEDGQNSYVTEDGTSNYVTET